MTAREIASIEQRGEPWRNVTIVAPRAGVVLHRGISVGTSVDPSTELFTVVDLSRVWAMAEVPEATAAQVREGTTAQLAVPGSGTPPLEARVDFVYPTLSERTRTVRVRFVLDNADGALRPGMFGTAVFAMAAHDALTLPRDAIVDTGIRQHVFVAGEDSSFVPRVVELGLREDERVEIASGLVEGERVVAAGVFLVDSESRLRASGGGTGHAHGGTTTETSAAERERRRPSPGADPHAAHGTAP
jgi:Cu(I)/Ag(I) efflux system membrane fusion protein